MSEKKVVSRRMFIAFEIVCIILIACLVGATSLYSWQINDKDNTISSLNSQISQLNTNATNLQNQNTNLTNQVNDLTSTVNLEKSVVWVSNQSISQQAGNYTDFSFQVSNLAGYISVNVTSSTTDKTYVEVTYSGHVYPGIYYDSTRTVGTNGTADFPFAVEPVLVSPFMTPLPTIIEIRVGNTNTVGNATETVTITFYY